MPCECQDLKWNRVEREWNDFNLHKHGTPLFCRQLNMDYSARASFARLMFDTRTTRKSIREDTFEWVNTAIPKRYLAHESFTIRRLCSRFLLIQIK